MSQPKSYFQPVDTIDEYPSSNAEQEPNGTLSKQFQPRKFKDGSKLWNQDSTTDQEETQSYSYTPFKASTLNKTPKPTRDGPTHSGTLRPPKSHPFVYDASSTQTTPRVPRSRPESAAAMHRNTGTWGRAASAQPHPAHFRSASAMSHGRRPNNEFMPPFQTMPRPPMEAFPPMIPSRPPSVMTQTPQPQGFPVPMIEDRPSPRAVATQLAIGSSYVNWNRVSIICCIQVLFCLSIFGIGIARIMYGSLWGIGIEIIYATCAMFPALIGIYAVKKASYSAAMICFSANALQIVFATIPFFIGLFPALPFVFPKVQQQWVVAENEPIHYDLVMSFLVAAQALFAFHLSVFGCKAVGTAMVNIEEIKLHTNMRAAFDENQLPFKPIA